MRLHHLEVTAFGPFADTAAVDLDDLSSAGLFLLSGPTGSGKTSILDAVCFALYGDVPGDRNTAKRYRCDTAPPGLAPRVRLEVTMAGRRFRLTRSPAWQRPKKRGNGITTEHASVLLEERISGEWSAVSSRLDEAGHLVSSLLGMTMGQFCQVAMLPQGRFQAFLRARSEDRHKLLQHLFATQRFEDIERWVREHARSLHRHSQELQRGVSRLVSRTLEVADGSLPETWSLDDLAPQATGGEIADWSAGLRAAAALDAEAAAGGLTAAEEADATARRQRDDGHRVAELRSRATTARAEIAVLTADAAAHDERRRVLVASRRAAPVVPLHRLVTTTTHQADGASDRALTARSAASELLGLDDPTDSALADALGDLRRAHTLAGRALPREQELQALRAEVADARRALVELAAREADALDQTETVPAQVEALRERLAAAHTARADAERLGAEVTTIEGRLAAHQRADALRVALLDATDQQRATIDECQALKEHWLAVTEARIRGMAAEIATDLAVGACCPVCGSADHPHKAEPTDGAPTAESEKAARRAVDDAESIRAALDAKVHELTSSARIAEHEAGDDDAPTLRQLLERARADHDRAGAVARTAGEIESAMVLAERTLQAATKTLGEARVEIAARAAQLARDTDSANAIEHELADLLGGSDHDDLPTLVADQSRVLEVGEEAVRLGTEAVARDDEATRARDELSAWLVTHGFATADEALAAVLDDEAAEALERAVTHHDARVAAASAVLDDEAVAAAEASAVPDLAALDDRAARMGEELARARTHAQFAVRRAARLAELADELAGALDAWHPVIAAYAVASELAAFVEGKSADNELRMRLSAYVLAWRLSQVVAAANERLLGMTDQRYTLEHTGRRGAGERRGGLSLLVLDEWSGERRDPATLSGGETFVVSLALALGLADVVAHEAGGAQLDTLFVDEGFGSLDSDTLDDVMNTLDTLRDGGRVVGVVSHVAEMRSRIPTQLVVAKDRGSGSSVTITRNAV